MDIRAVKDSFLFCQTFNKKLNISFPNPSTKAVFDKIGVQSDLKHVTGMINFRLRQMHLMESGCHEDLAKQEGLQVSTFVLKKGWFPFSLNCADIHSGLLEVSTFSSPFGGMPIKYSSIFEKSIKGLFGSKADRILFLQMGYERGISDAEKADWTKILRSRDMLWASTSLSNYEIEKFLLK